MKVYDAANIRNVALVGHSGSGKTQLASAALSDAGMINRFGKVDDGTTVTDFDEEEIARKHTLSASVAYAEWNKQKINLRCASPTPPSSSSTQWPGSWCRPKRCGRRPTSSTCRDSSCSTGSIGSARASNVRSNRCTTPATGRSFQSSCPSARKGRSRASSISSRRRHSCSRPTRAASSPKRRFPPTWPPPSTRRARR
ncbi:MAG: hypothetical protein DMG03_20325 [Acidobacteria bacterium]|nr:MAG: hypothetical protein DMG03_20325 [Acidobacteriota bacterium]